MVDRRKHDLDCDLSAEGLVPHGGTVRVHDDPIAARVSGLAQKVASSTGHRSCVTEKLPVSASSAAPRIPAIAAAEAVRTTTAIAP